MEKVLETVRKILGGDMIDRHFDPEIIIHINTTIATLDQLGVTFTKRIVDEDTTWDELVPDTQPIEWIKTYIPCKVKMIFDPPTGSSAMSALEKVIDECEFRIHMASDSSKTTMTLDQLLTDDSYMSLLEKIFYKG